MKGVKFQIVQICFLFFVFCFISFKIQLTIYKEKIPMTICTKFLQRVTLLYSNISIESYDFCALKHIAI